jgi:hypothetical protein
MTDDALIEAMARAMLEAGGFEFCNDPSQCSLNVYELTCEAIADAQHALAAIRKTHAVVPRLSPKPSGRWSPNPPPPTQEPSL